jgi:hypothetical protein
VIVAQHRHVQRDVEGTIPLGALHVANQPSVGQLDRRRDLTGAVAAAVARRQVIADAPPPPLRRKLEIYDRRFVVLHELLDRSPSIDEIADGLDVGCARRWSRVTTVTARKTGWSRIL